MPPINVTANTGPRALVHSIALQMSGSVVLGLGELMQLENWRNLVLRPTSVHAGTRVAEQEPDFT